MRIQVDGRQVYFGRGSGVLKDQADSGASSIVFVHGAGFDHSVWVMPARYFARKGYVVVSPDLPGHGRSEGPALESIEDMAVWLGKVVDQTTVGDVTVVGHSMGSLVAYTLGGMQPERVSRLVLIGTSNPMRVGPPLLNAARDNDPAAYQMANVWSHSSAGRIGASQNPGMSNFVSGLRWLERNQEDVYFRDLNACNEFVTEPVDLSMPTLVIIGEADRMTSPGAGVEVATSQSAETVVLSGAGHAMLNEQPNQVLDALSEFIEE